MKNRNEDNGLFTIMQHFYKVFYKFCVIRAENYLD